MGQAAWDRNITQKVAGRQVDYHAQAFSDVVTGRNELSTAIFPGRFVVQGTTDDDVKIDDSGATGATFIGLAVDNENRERVGATLATTGYVQYALVPVARDGRWYAECEEAVTKGGTVFVRYVAGAGGSIIGQVRGDVDTASAEAVTAKFAETTTGAGLVAIELNMAQV